MSNGLATGSGTGFPRPASAAFAHATRRIHLEGLQVASVPVMFEKDIEGHEKYTACIEGCSGGEDGLIQCAHCC